MTQKQHNELERFEETLNQARHGYYRAITRQDLDDMNAISVGLGFTIAQTQMGCGRCVLDYLKRLSTEYYSFKPTEEKPKRTRKSKSEEKETVSNNE